MSRWNLSLLLGITGATLVGLSLLYSAPNRDISALKQRYQMQKLFAEVLDKVEKSYVKEMPPEKMRELVEIMIDRGLERLDQHSAYINAQKYKQFQNQSSGKFGGVGIVISPNGFGQVFVESPIYGTPAYKNGIRVGDLIVAVDSDGPDGPLTMKTLQDLSLSEVVEMIQGEPGKKVTLKDQHEEEKKPEEIVLTRAEIKIESVLGNRRNKDELKNWDYWIDPKLKIGYIRITQFSKTTVKEIRYVVAALQAEGMKGLVLDLRDNPGGLLSGAIGVSSMFLEKGKTVVSTKGRNQESKSYRARSIPGVRPGDYPMVILINGGSASASEIVAAALKDHGRAIIIGERSYGKGSVQNIILLEGGTSALKLTTASYWRPNNHNIHRFRDSKDEDEWGVKPDSKEYTVEFKDRKERLAYYKYMRDKYRIYKPGTEPKKDEELDFEDVALEKALEYLRGKVAGQKEPAANLAPEKNQNIPEVPATGEALVPQPNSRSAFDDLEDDRPARLFDSERVVLKLPA